MEKWESGGYEGDYIKGLSTPTNFSMDERKESSSVTQITLIGESSINPWMTPTL
jgi:hypothetical protein